MFGLFKKEVLFDKFRLQSALKMAVTRLQMQRTKKDNQLKQLRRELAGLLRSKKTESARIRVEGLIREGFVMDALELVSLFCELLGSRVQLIAECKTCPPDLAEAASTLVWVAPRLEGVPELLVVREQLHRKYGGEFTRQAMENTAQTVNERVLRLLSVVVPEPYVCVQQLQQIAEENEVPWDEATAAALLHPLSGVLACGGGGGASSSTGSSVSEELPLPSAVLRAPSGGGGGCSSSSRGGGCP
eukprot:RCo047804